MSKSTDNKLSELQARHGAMNLALIVSGLWGTAAYFLGYDLFWPWMIGLMGPNIGHCVIAWTDKDKGD